MKIFSSLTNRIFLGSALLTVVAIAVAVYRVNVAVTAQAENELHRGLDEAGTLLEEYRTTLFEHYAREARLVADLPKFKAVLDTKDPLTVQPIAEEYQRLLGCDLFLVTDPSGRLLAEAGRLTAGDQTNVSREPIERARAGKETVSLWPHAGGVIQVVTVPSVTAPELFGALTVGFSLDEQTAGTFKRLTNSEIAFALDGRVEASTLPAQYNAQLGALVGGDGIRIIDLGEVEYVAVSRALPLPAAGGDTLAVSGPHATALILRSRTERLRFLDIVHQELAGTALLAVLAATLVSYAVARTVTRPLGAITATMREMASTGDLTKKIALSPGTRWDDEDARLLAGTFNAMTDSIARFQREAAQRERLSSLGRLSTVVAHEIRNPLMIIRTALRSLKQEPGQSPHAQSAVADVDEEVTRLNRLVSEVLDFARPIRFDLGPVDVNALCEDAARAAGAEAPSVKVHLDLDGRLTPIVTDGERLRLALVNILTNARHAVLAQADRAGGEQSGIRVVTTRTPGGRVAIDVRDQGIGIAPDDLGRVFDPYFTTRRTGTGLGLAISRNIIEGLGGTITVSSRAGSGTDVRIQLPRSEESSLPREA
ncbi:MAG: ATP-binding protein [Acidobacteriota bacterium]|nr:ATP-binding protein [Acidobacteriota bacterium]